MRVAPSKFEHLIQDLITATDDQERTRIQSQLVEVPFSDRSNLRQELIKVLGSLPDDKSLVTTRGWLANTLAKVSDDDNDTYNALLQYLLVKNESSKWVRYWTLEGLWAGDSKIRSETLDDILAMEKEPLVRLLVKAIQSAANGLGKDPDLSQSLSDPTLQYEALRALRVVPLPDYRNEVQAIHHKLTNKKSDKATNKKMVWNAWLAIDKMDERVEPSKVTGISLENSAHIYTEASEAKLTPQSRMNNNIRRSKDGETFYVNGIPLLVIDSMTSSSKSFRIWFAVLDSGTLNTLLNESGAFHRTEKRDIKKKRTKTNSQDYVLLVGADQDGNLYGLAELADPTEGVPSNSLALRAIQPFDPPIPGKELRQAVSDPDLFKQHGLSLLTDEQWAIIRELICFHQPKFDKALPESQVKEQVSAVISRIDIPSSLEIGSSFTVSMTVRNTGNLTWPIKQEYRIDCTIQRQDMIEKLKPVWLGQHSEGIPPGHEFTCESPTYNAPDAVGDYSVRCSFYGDTNSTNFEPVTETRQIRVKKNDFDEKTTSKFEKEGDQDTVHTDNLTEINETDSSPANVDTNPITTPELPVTRPELEVRREIIRIREQYQAPSIDDRLILEILHQEAKLTFNNQEYYSSFEIPVELLSYQLQPRKYGEALFQAVFNDAKSRPPRHSTQYGFRKAMEALQKAPETRFRFEIKIPADYEYLNWERLAPPDQARPPIATNERLPFYRRVDNKDVTPVPAPLKVLVAICNPSALGREDNNLLKNLSPLKVAEERQSFRLGLEPLQEVGLAEYRILGRDNGKPVTLEQLTDEMRKGTHVLHLLAHGLYVEDDYYIVMERGNGERPLIKAKELAQMLIGTGQALRLAILVACESGVSDQNRGTGASLGSILVNTGFPAVISMQDKLGLQTAQLFNQRFYFHLARSGQVESALSATRFDLRQGKLDLAMGWSIPMLHLGAKTGKLFDVDEDKASRLDDVPPQVLSANALRNAELSGGDQLRKALQAEAGTAGLNEEQLGAISRIVRENLGHLQTTITTGHLAQPQNISSLQRKMAHRVQLESKKLKEAVASATKLRLPDAVFDQIASVINAGKHVVLIGPPGTGKTRLAHAVCKYSSDSGFSTGTIPTTASADWTTFDTVGGYVPTSTQHLEFRPGIFLRAISSARWLVVDEINRAEIDKAIGELFTVLSGQQVDLPYRVAGHSVRILPFKQRNTNDWVPDKARPDEYDYVVHPNWRILATMNIYDKSSLFSMSFAFMRRFAFVDVGIPSDEDFDDLCMGWINQERKNLHDKFASDEELKTALDDIARRFKAILNKDSSIMRHRELGPAIIKDMIAYICDRASQQEEPSLPELLAESFLLYAVPQFDGLSRDVITTLYCHLKGNIFVGLDSGIKILERIESLYPHIPASDWQTTFDQWQASESLEESRD